MTEPNSHRWYFVLVFLASLTTVLLLRVCSCFLPVSDFQFCEAKQKDTIMNVLHELYNHLSVQAGKFQLSL